MLECGQQEQQTRILALEPLQQTRAIILRMAEDARLQALLLMRARAPRKAASPSLTKLLMSLLGKPGMK